MFHAYFTLIHWRPERGASWWTLVHKSITGFALLRERLLIYLNGYEVVLCTNNFYVFDRLAFVRGEEMRKVCPPAWWIDEVHFLLGGSHSNRGGKEQLKAT